MYNALNEQQMLQELDYRRQQLRRRGRMLRRTGEEPKVRRTRRAA